jgi:hypothetical protein
MNPLIFYIISYKSKYNSVPALVAERLTGRIYDGKKKRA